VCQQSAHIAFLSIFEQSAVLADGLFHAAETCKTYKTYCVFVRSRHLCVCSLGDCCLTVLLDSVELVRVTDLTALMTQLTLSGAVNAATAKPPLHHSLRHQTVKHVCDIEHCTIHSGIRQ